ncbi:MAG: hypothetical protein ACYSSN_01695 [Planctomycetota bacterium]|jgi:hypothetical protein
MYNTDKIAYWAGVVKTILQRISDDRGVLHVSTNAFIDCFRMSMTSSYIKGLLIPCPLVKLSSGKKRYGKK